MRRNAFLLTMGLAGGLLANGCQQRPLSSPRTTVAAAAPAPASAPANYNVQVTTDPAKPEAPLPPAAPLPQAPVIRTPMPAHIPPARGYATEFIGPTTLPPAAQASPHLVDKARTGPATPAAAPAPRQQPVSRPALPPPAPEGLPSSKQIDPNASGTLIISEQSTDRRPLMTVANRTVTPVAPPPKQAAPAPTEGLCTLTGEAQEFRKAFRLRYAPVDSNDPHGGSVVLVGENLQRLRDGQTVRVVGTLQPAADRHDSPRFLVHFLEVVAP